MKTTFSKSTEKGCVVAITRHYSPEELAQELKAINQQLFMAKELLEVKKQMEALLG